MSTSNTENTWCSVLLWSETWTSYLESTGTSELNWFLNLVLKQPWEHMTHSMISWGWANLMWPIAKEWSYLLARNATWSVSFEWHLQHITLTSFYWKKRIFHLARRLLSPLCLWYLTKEICSCTFPWNELQFVVLFCIHLSEQCLFSVSLPTSQQLFLCFCQCWEYVQKWILYFPCFSTISRWPTQMHKVSELVDSLFFAPQERDMV